MIQWFFDSDPACRSLLPSISLFWSISPTGFSGGGSAEGIFLLFRNFRSVFRLQVKMQWGQKKILPRYISITKHIPGSLKLATSNGSSLECACFVVSLYPWKCSIRRYYCPNCKALQDSKAVKRRAAKAAGPTTSAPQHEAQKEDYERRWLGGDSKDSSESDVNWLGKVDTGSEGRRKKRRRMEYYGGKCNPPSRFWRSHDVYTGQVIIPVMSALGCPGSNELKWSLVWLLTNLGWLLLGIKTVDPCFHSLPADSRSPQTSQQHNFCVGH